MRIRVDRATLYKAFYFQGGIMRTGFRSILLMAALGGLYYYRRNGGSIRDLLRSAFGAVSNVREQINRVAPSVAERIPSTYQPSTTV
jgi:hypothetical protein